MRMWPWVLTGDFLCIYQRTNRMPKDIHVDPEKFAAELISRLEGVLREREAQEKLEERLKRVRLVSAFQLPGLTHDCQMNVLHEFYNMQRFKMFKTFPVLKVNVEFYLLWKCNYEIATVSVMYLWAACLGSTALWSIVSAAPSEITLSLRRL